MSLTIRCKSKLLIFSDKNDYHNDRFEDIVIDYIDDDHVRLKKLFPFCHLNPVPDLESYKRFHIRIYIPQEVYSDKLKKVEKCFICFNGLDEIEHFTLYDQIGKGLARNGYATILLPLPNHLNRNSIYRFNDYERSEKPSDVFINEPNKIYEAYDQIVEEVKILTKHLLGKCEFSAGRDCCDFYRRYFSDKLKISLLGYSLGGLLALSNFIINDHDYNSCILLNSGAKLEDINVSEFVKKDKWKLMVESLQKTFFMQKIVDEKFHIFEMIFLGNGKILFKGKLKEKSSRLLFIISGADNVTKFESILELETDGHGLSILKLPGMHHFLSIDTHWDRWFPVVNNFINDFDKSASKQHLYPNDILHCLAFFQIQYKISKKIGHCDVNTVQDSAERDILSRAIFAAKCTYGNISIAFIEMYKLLNSARKNPSLYPYLHEYLDNKLFFESCAEIFKLDKKLIKKLLNKQLEYASSEEEVPRMGELMVSEGILTQDQLDEFNSLEK